MARRRIKPKLMTPRRSATQSPGDEFKRRHLFQVAAVSDSAPTGLYLLNEVETAATSVCDAIVSAARFTFPPKTVAMRIVDRAGQIAFERHKAGLRQIEAKKADR
jgi:hypothetical protein